jgi:hypothetical protein
MAFRQIASRASRAAVAPLVAAVVLLTTGCGSQSNDGGAMPSLRLPPESGTCSGSLSSYPGDCNAPTAADVGDGLLAHYGPSDYDDPDDVASFVIGPGAEFVDCTYSALPNDTPVSYNRYSVFSRPGMHHIILYSQQSDVAKGTHDDCDAKNHDSSLLAVLQGGIQGSRYDYPPSGTIAPENAGLATALGPHQMIAYEMHAVNATDEPLLKENWTVFRAMPSSDVKETVGQFAFNGGLAMHIAPHSQQTITNTCTVDSKLGDVRVVDFFAHMHAHSERFSAWVHRKAQDTRQLIYESYDWSILDLIEFNSVKQNAPITYEGGTPGGFSGDLSLSVGDSIEYECKMNNTGDTALTFSARAFDGEMCNMFGSFTPGTYWSCLGD